jgi:hypothetical protein
MRGDSAGDGVGVGGSLSVTFSEIPTLLSTSPANGRNTARRAGSYLVASLTIAAAPFFYVFEIYGAARED